MPPVCNKLACRDRGSEGDLSSRNTYFGGQVRADIETFMRHRELRLYLRSQVERAARVEADPKMLRCPGRYQMTVDYFR